MEFVLLILSRKGETGEPVTMEEMGRFAGELAREGRIRGGAPLHPEAEAVRLQLRDGKALITDGPFAESKEVCAGTFVIDAKDLDEAVAIAKRCPAARAGVVEVRVAPDRDPVPAPRAGKRFLLLLLMEPSLTDDDGSGYREMVAYDGELKREGCYVESSQLALEPPGARIEVRAGKALVTDGPFAETKEVAGGYYVIQADTRAQVVAIAQRCPHAKWGTVEIREVVDVGPPGAA